MIKIHEVTLRDGLQSWREKIPTETKIDIAKKLSLSGFSSIELGSFISPKIGKMYENLSDTEEVYKSIKKSKQTKYYALVPTFDYYKEAVKAGFKNIATFLSANQIHNKLNVNRTIEQSLDEINKIKQNAKESEINIRVYIATAFGYKSKSDVSINQLKNIANSIIDEDIELCLGDTFGLANQEEIFNRIKALENMIDRSKLALHFHHTNPNIWKKNIDVALALGIEIFDSSLLGLGGCPTDKYMGNISTEQLVQHLESRGIKTNLDLAKIIKLSVELRKQLNMN